ncbi:lambda exonuclease family protein [Bradyrhizobium genosp. L]|uniref:lambda exonuclease family protein n=1 Tax=Bradyrhizobium genosp. L TaxID=83637 RepID=UPI001FEEA46A|nr:lambda exonuclease family protein [Bradyrhizobium genosp. L]
MDDKTNHNLLAEQFAARLREETPVPAEAPKKPRRPRVVETAPAAAEPVITAADLPEHVVTPFAWPIVDPLQIMACEQNTADWQRARMGIATSSSFDAVLTPGKTKTEQKTRRTYLLKLAGEVLTGQPMEMVTTRDMERGHLLEPEARDLYMLQTGEMPERVGFLRRDRVGCSPDSLIGDNGGLEIKTKAPHLLIDVILKDEFPEEHKAQVQGALWITGRDWWDIAVYWPGIPLFVKRTFRDEAYIKTLAAEVDRFNADLDEVVALMRQRGDATPSEFVAAA